MIKTEWDRNYLTHLITLNDELLIYIQTVKNSEYVSWQVGPYRKIL